MIKGLEGNKLKVQTFSTLKPDVEYELKEGTCALPVVTDDLVVHAVLLLPESSATLTDDGWRISLGGTDAVAWLAEQILPISYFKDMFISSLVGVDLGDDDA